MTHFCLYFILLPLYAQNGSSATLELDLEHYVVPAPSTCANSGLVYAANMTETPRSLTLSGVFSKADGPSSTSHSVKDGGGVSMDRPSTIKVYFGNSYCEDVNLIMFSLQSEKPLCVQKHYVRPYEVLHYLFSRLRMLKCNMKLILVQCITSC